MLRMPFSSIRFGYTFAIGRALLRPLQLHQKLNMDDSRKVVVVGAGVVGLTTVYELLERGIDGNRIQVLTDQTIAETTSTVAGALWEM